jgi:hypothetical protein
MVEGGESVERDVLGPMGFPLRFEAAGALTLQGRGSRPPDGAPFTAGVHLREKPPADAVGAAQDSR